MNATPSTTENPSPLSDCGAYAYELHSHKTHRWTHAETGLTVVMSPTTARGPYGRDQSGYRVFARDAPDGDVVAHISGCGMSRALPGKTEATATAREWMGDRPDGRLTGNEEVRY